MTNENSPKTVSDYWSEEAKADKLYIAIRANATAEIERLKAEGITLSDYIRAMLKFGGGSHENYKKYGMDWYNFNFNLSKNSSEEFITVIRNLYAELGEPICYTDTVKSKTPEFYSAKVFRCVLDCFDSKKIPKKQTLHEIIERGNTELLEIVAEHNWFRLAKTCDEYIEYANEKGQTECAAWLIDYKKRAFDLNKEREKAEKKAERELNAAPDSVTALKGLWSWKKSKSENCDGLAITKYKGDRTEIVIPDKIGKNNVSALEVDTYDWGMPKKGFVSPKIKSAVTKITLPKGLVSIGTGVFFEFTALCDIDIPDGVLNIEKYAFYKCKSLSRLTLPDSVKKIGKFAFNSCVRLEEIKLPRGITELGDRIFEICERLKAVEIPSSVQSIGEYAFSRCGDLENITVPNGVTEISECTFSDCKNLTRVELPDTIVKIGKCAFIRCASLKELVIPEGVREIGEVAFADCAALERIVLPASLEKAANYTINGFEPTTILDNCPNVTAAVTPKSYAEDYCKQYNIPFVYNEN